MCVFDQLCLIGFPPACQSIISMGGACSPPPSCCFPPSVERLVQTDWLQQYGTQQTKQLYSQDVLYINSSIIISGNNLTNSFDGFYHNGTSNDSYTCVVVPALKSCPGINTLNFDTCTGCSNPIGCGNYLCWKPAGSCQTSNATQDINATNTQISSAI